MSDDHKDDDKAGQPSRPRKTRSPNYENALHKKGKYRPPAEHQFQPGNKAAAKRRTAKRSTVLDHDKILQERVKVGEDSRGRPIRKTAKEVISRQLINKAMKGELSSIKVVLDHGLKMEALKRGMEAPEKTQDDIRAEIEQEKISKEFSEEIVELFKFIQNAKKRGIIDTSNGLKHFPWVDVAISQYLERHGPPPNPDDKDVDGS